MHEDLARDLETVGQRSRELVVVVNCKESGTSQEAEEGVEEASRVAIKEVPQTGDNHNHQNIGNAKQRRVVSDLDDIAVIHVFGEINNKTRSGNVECDLEDESEKENEKKDLMLEGVDPGFTQVLNYSDTAVLARGGRGLSERLDILDEYGQIDENEEIDRGDSVDGNEEIMSPV